MPEIIAGSDSQIPRLPRFLVKSMITISSAVGTILPMMCPPSICSYFCRATRVGDQIHDSGDCVHILDQIKSHKLSTKLHIILTRVKQLAISSI